MAGIDKAPLNGAQRGQRFRRIRVITYWTAFAGVWVMSLHTWNAGRVDAWVYAFLVILALVIVGGLAAARMFQDQNKSEALLEYVGTLCLFILAALILHPIVGMALMLLLGE